MATALRDPVTGNIIAHPQSEGAGDRHIALDADCAELCCGGCWWRIRPCDCEGIDDEEEGFVRQWWRCEWADLIGGGEVSGMTFEFEDRCYRIDQTTAVTELPEGDFDIEFPFEEIAALTWFEDCESTYEPGEEPEDPPTLIETGCCDPCARDCDDCASSYDANVSLAYSLTSSQGGLLIAITSCIEELNLAIVESMECGECCWAIEDSVNLVDCVCSHTIDGEDPQPVLHIAIGFIVQLQCPTAEDPDVYYRATLTARICARTEAEPDCDPCDDGFTGHQANITLEWRKPGLCPAGVYALHAASASPGLMLSPVINASASTLEIS